MTTTYTEQLPITYTVGINDGYDGSNYVSITIPSVDIFSDATLDAAAQAFFAVLDNSTTYSIVSSEKTRPATAHVDWTYTA